MKDNLTSIELSIYYDKINELVDKYINEWGIAPSKLNSYLRVGNKSFDKFLLRSGLNDFKYINKVVTDVLEDRLAMEEDGILHYGEYMIKESVFNNIPATTIDHEKILADLYNTSLGHINILDGSKHLYEVSDFGDKVSVIIYSEQELEDIKKNIKGDFINKLSGKNIKIDDLNVVLKISDITSSDKLNDKFEEALDYENLMSYILKLLKSNLSKSTFKYKEFKGYHIWEIVE